MEAVLLAVIAGLLLTNHVMDISKSDQMSLGDLWTYGSVFLFFSLIPALVIYGLARLISGFLV